jgi:hypothetical protein
MNNTIIVSIIIITIITMLLIYIVLKRRSYQLLYQNVYLFDAANDHDFTCVGEGSVSAKACIFDNKQTSFNICNKYPGCIGVWELPQGPYIQSRYNDLGQITPGKTYYQLTSTLLMNSNAEPANLYGKPI